MGEELKKEEKKETSFIAVFSFFLSASSWFILIIDEVFHLSPVIPTCTIIPALGLTGLLLGIFSIIYIDYLKKGRFTGRWFAILAIALGAVGAMLVC
jgi:hypothetical protein